MKLSLEILETLNSIACEVIATCEKVGFGDYVKELNEDLYKRLKDENIAIIFAVSLHLASTSANELYMKVKTKEWKTADSSSTVH